MSHEERSLTTVVALMTSPANAWLPGSSGPLQPMETYRTANDPSHNLSASNPSSGAIYVSPDTEVRVCSQTLRAGRVGDILTVRLIGTVPMRRRVPARRHRSPPTATLDEPDGIGAANYVWRRTRCSTVAWEASQAFDGSGASSQSNSVWTATLPSPSYRAFRRTGICAFAGKNG